VSHIIDIATIHRRYKDRSFPTHNGSISIITMTTTMNTSQPAIMPRGHDIDDFIYGMTAPYSRHIQTSGAFNQEFRYPLPNLSNDILPMFKYRWVQGQGQHNADISQYIEPALRLASRFLTEKYPLLWFSHLTFGERRRSGSGTYIVPTSYSLSADAIDKVRQNILNVGEVITLMFLPAGYREKGMGGAYGITYKSKSDAAFHQDFEWPRISRRARQGCAHPLVTISHDYQDFFRIDIRSATQDEVYRVLFSLATTLVHEFTHAYNLWLSPERDEPRWNKNEKAAELGWSWEHNVIGYGLHNFKIPGARGLRTPFLYQCRVMAYSSPGERQGAFQQLAGSNRNDSLFTMANASGRIIPPPVLDASTIRRSALLLENASRVHSFVAAAQVVPMTWVVNWFQEEHWYHHNNYWRQQQMYVRPTLGNPFVVLYECDGCSTATYRPLYPAFSVDRDILERRARGDNSR
jgi:hypothetical protein